MPDRNSPNDSDDYPDVDDVQAVKNPNLFHSDVFFLHNSIRLPGARAKLVNDITVRTYYNALLSS